MKQCGSECVNTKSDKTNCGGCNRKCKGSNSCKGGTCTSKLGCKKGQPVCTDPNYDPSDPFCPGDDSENCLCLTSVDGIAFCSDTTAGGCVDCASSADCPDGQLCTDLSGVNCNCDEGATGTGNACSAATCDGIGSSGAGRPGGVPRGR